MRRNKIKEVGVPPILKRRTTMKISETVQIALRRNAALDNDSDRRPCIWCGQIEDHDTGCFGIDQA